MKLRILFTLLFPVALAQAQNELPGGQLEVIKDFEVRLAKSEKIRIVPQAVPFDSSARRYVYQLNAPSPSIAYETPQLKPLAIEPEQKPTYYPFFAKAGFGNPNSWLGQVSYDHLQSDDFHWGVSANFLNANNKKFYLQRFSQFDARLNASYNLQGTHLIEGFLTGDWETHYFYGLGELPPNPDAVKRVFNRYEGQVSLKKLMGERDRFGYFGTLGMQVDKDDLGTRESGLLLDLGIHGLLSADDYPYGLTVTADLSTLKHTAEFQLNNYILQPYFEYGIGDLKIHLGARGLLNEVENEILPDIRLTYPVLGTALNASIGWEGQVMMNNFRSFSRVNPYITTRLDSVNNYIARSLFGSVHGRAGKFNYEAKVSYARFKNLALFLQDNNEAGQFAPVFDGGHYIGLEGVLDVQVLKNVQFNARVFNRFYKLDTEAKPWHVQSFGLKGFLKYTGEEDRYHVSVLVHAENGLPFRTPGGTEMRLDALLDLNIHADYFITPSIGVFGELNNVLNNKRERWVNYPSFGFNGKAGVIIRVP